MHKTNVGNFLGDTRAVYWCVHGCKKFAYGTSAYLRENILVYILHAI